MLISLFILFGIILASLLFAFLLSSVLQSDKEESDTSMDAIIQTNMALIVTSTVDLTSEILTIVTGKTLLFFSGIPGQTLNLARFGLIVGGAIVFHESYTYFLTGGDTISRTLLGPLFQDVIFSIMQIVRLIYDAIIPLFNYYSTIVGQVTSGSISIAIKCDLTVVVETLKLLLFSFVSLFKSTIEFAGGQSIDNNIMVNEWNLTDTFDKFQGIVAKQEPAAACVCDGLTDILDILFSIVQTPHLPRSLNHAWNIPVSIVQDILQILPPYTKVPHLSKVMFHLGSMVWEFAKFMDLVGVTLFNKIIQLFIPEFSLRGVPEQFIMATQARLWLAVVEVVHVIYRTAIHIIVPIPVFLSDPEYMSKAMDFGKVFIHLELWNYGNANIVHWVGLMVKRISVGLVRAIAGGKFQITGIPEHVKLNCDKVSSFIHFDERVPCFFYHSAQIPISTAHLAQSLFVELLWFSVVFQKQNLWRTLQRYDGMVQSNDITYSCQHRRDNMKWDKTKEECLCNKPTENFPFTITRGDPFGNKQKLYDPYCGQPTLQANVWHHTIMATRQAAEGTLADSYYLLYKTYYLGILEGAKLALRFVLALPDIFEGNFIDIPINCGWGTGNYTGCNIRRHERNTINWCDGSNKQGCTCNPLLPLNDTTLCQCIYYYPDAEQEVAQTGFSNPLLKQLYKPSVRHHWCGTYSAEAFLSLTEDFAYFIDNVVSQFAPAYNSNNNNYCESKAYQMLATDVLQYSRNEWNNDLLGPLGLSYTKNSCQLYGSYDVICSGSMTIRTGVLLVTQQLRAMIMTFSSILSLDIASFKVDLSERLCDLQRAAAGASATVAAIFPVGFVGPGVQQGLARMMYSVLDVAIVVIRFANNFLLWFSDVIRGAVVGRSPEMATFQLIVNQLNLLIDWLRRVLQAFGTFMNGIYNGAGMFFFVLDKVLSIFQSILSQAVLEIVGLLFKVSAGIIEYFTDGDVYNGFFYDLFLLITKFFDMCMAKAYMVFDQLARALFPITAWINAQGEVLRTICRAFESVFSGETGGCGGGISASSAGINTNVSENLYGDDDTDSGTQYNIPGNSNTNSSYNLRSDPHNHIFWASPDTPLRISESMDWDGVSRCDILVHQYKNYTWNQLRPLEQNEIRDCLEARYITQEIINSTELPIPIDILYNWKRKYMVAFDLGYASILYGRHMFGGLTTSEMLRIMKHDHVRLDIYIPVFHKIRNFISSIFTMQNIDNTIHAAFQEFPNIETTDSGVGNMYRLYKHTSGAMKKAYPKLVELPYHFKKMKNVVPKSHILRNSFNFTHHINEMSTHLKQIPPLFKTLSKNRPRTKSKTTARSMLSPILGAAGVDADLTPCNQREDSYVCVNCIVLDNIFNTVIREGKRMAGYYENTFALIIVPDFKDFFYQQEQRAKAYRNNIGDSFEEAHNNAKEAENTMRSSFSNETVKISNRQRAGKDWDYLFENWAIRNDEDIVDILTRFVGTTGETYVPFFGYGLGYYIAYPFTEACPMEIIYCDTSTTQERVNYISQQFTYQAMVFGGLYLGQVYTGAPLFSFASGFPAMLLIMGAIYMWTVYSYIYTCAPNMPNCFMDDLFVWFYEVAYPECFCSYYPGLSNICNPEDCYFSGRVTEFKSCTTEVPMSSLDNLGYFWSPTFWFRKEFPDAFLWLYKTPPFSYFFQSFDGIKDIAMRLQDDIPITLAEIDCLGLRYSDLVLIGVIIYVVSFALSILIPITIKVTVHIFKLAILMANAMFAFGVATELQTIVGLEED